MLTETLQNLFVLKQRNIIFVSPEPSDWPSLLAENKLITENLPNRLESRRELLGIARNYTLTILDVVCPNNSPENIIATGHQAIWHHSGIWAKNLTTCQFAKAVDGQNLHLILDHDFCDTAMVLPIQNKDGSWYFKKIEIEPKQEPVPLEFRKVSQDSYIKTFINTVINAPAGQFCGDIWSKCGAFKKNKISRFNNIADLITCLQGILNVALGLDMLYLPVSKLSQSSAFINFVISIILDAASFATYYNDAITKHINERKTDPGETVRRLVLDEKKHFTELPFWLLSANGKRTSLYVTSNKTNRITISDASTELGNLDLSCLSGKNDQLKNLLEQFGYRLRPKAVSLTLFVRLFLADWFVHGVGGVLYEPVTDYLIENYYKIKPLKFGVATCTMTSPLPNTAAFPEDNIAQLKHKQHNIKHNPDRYINESMLKKEPVASLLQIKEERIAQTKDLSLPSALRKSAWISLSIINKKLFEYAKDTDEELEKKIVESEKNKISQEVCNCREYFFGLFPVEKLRKVAESLTFTEYE